MSDLIFNETSKVGNEKRSSLESFIMNLLVASNGRPKCLVRLFFQPSYYRESKLPSISSISCFIFAFFPMFAFFPLWFHIHQLRRVRRRKSPLAGKEGGFFKLPFGQTWKGKKTHKSLFLQVEKKTFLFLVSTFARKVSKKNFFKLLLILLLLLQPPTPLWHTRKKTMKNTERFLSIYLFAGEIGYNTANNRREEAEKCFFPSSPFLSNFFYM